MNSNRVGHWHLSEIEVPGHKQAKTNPRPVQLLIELYPESILHSMRFEFPLYFAHLIRFIVVLIHAPSHTAASYKQLRPPPLLYSPRIITRRQKHFVDGNSSHREESGEQV